MGSKKRKQHHTYVSHPGQSRNHVNSDLSSNNAGVSEPDDQTKTPEKKYKGYVQKPDYAITTLVLGFAVTLIYLFQLFTMQKQLNFAIDAERAWMGVKEFSPQNPKADEWYPFAVTMVNAGRRPAQVTLLEFELNGFKEFPQNPPYDIPMDSPPSTALVVPGQVISSGRPRIFTSARLADLKQRGEKGYFYGHIDYIDVESGKKHTTHFCKVYVPEETLMTSCSFYNDGD